MFRCETFIAEVTVLGGGFTYRRRARCFSRHFFKEMISMTYLNKNAELKQGYNAYILSLIHI